ncbi:hypothetical protein E2C01_065983 [Portunus trituberculatus]|uniref:Uncharacterized protein n=1 Tax=Portunus trituberculatus TaxID=210409 RepID=A0A5B7HSN9_PORTR|nr:hypothetical protein [Portunus trituberculatus]
MFLLFVFFSIYICGISQIFQLREVSSTYIMTSLVGQSMPVYKTHMSYVTVTSVTPTIITVTSLYTPSLSFMHVSTTKVLNETVTVPTASAVTNTMLFTNTEVLVHTVTSTTVLTTLTTHHTTLPLTHLLTERHTITTPTILTHTASVTTTITTSHTALLTKVWGGVSLVRLG